MQTKTSKSRIKTRLKTTVSSLKDTQKERDTRNIRIDRVGVKELMYPVELRDKSHVSQHTIARIAMTVDLPHHFKGTHMSRFLEVLNANGREIHVKKIPGILKMMRKNSRRRKRTSSLSFHFSLRKKPR